MLILQKKLLMLLMMFKKLDKIRKERLTRQRLTVIESYLKLVVKLKKFYKKLKVIKIN